MRCNLEVFKSNISDFQWNLERTAENLSLIGHETEVIKNELEVTLTTNRADCKNLATLSYDLAGVYGLAFVGEKPDISTRTKIPVTIGEINKILGTQLSQNCLQDLTRLGFTVESEVIGVPQYRQDLIGKADIAEEVGRIYGFNKITPKPLSPSGQVDLKHYYQLLNMKLGLTEIGFTEVLSYTFIDKKSDWEVEQPHHNDEPFLRDSLLYGLLKTLVKNPYLKRGLFFEIGEIYRKEEEEYIGLVIFGYKDKQREELIRQAEEVLKAKVKVEVIHIDKGELEKYEVRQNDIYFIELPTKDCQPLSEATALKNVLKPVIKISKFPPLVRDVTIIDTQIAAEEIIEKVRNNYPTLLLGEIVDHYRSEEKNSVTIRFIFQKFEESYQETEINELTENLINFLKKVSGGKIN